MTKKQEEPAKMMEFILVNLDREEQEIAGKIQPLPSGVVPSEQFLQQTRAFLVTVMEGAGRRAA